ncbi:hypothetical protein BJ944DRAFT_110485 [Cunninghamella echinulata]|nr:hypothetical protein BJ944DRAFT_110485 [Cunninghamella echinulata]
MSKLTTKHINEFETLGYTILLNALTEDEVELLHDEADMLINLLLAEEFDLLIDLGGIIEPLHCGILDPIPSTEPQYQYKLDKATYIERRDQLTPSVAQLLINTIGSFARSLLYKTLDNRPDNSVYLLNEQYIIKPPNTKDTSIFEWHRDSDYYEDISLKNEKTIACWIALDPVNEENGTLHIKDINNSHQHGDSASLIVEIPAGSIVFMSSHLLHKSTGNASSKFRRVFMPQYSKRPLFNLKTFKPVALAVPISDIN